MTEYATLGARGHRNMSRPHGIYFYSPQFNSGGVHTRKEMKRGWHWIDADVTCFCGYNQGISNIGRGGDCLDCGHPTPTDPIFIAKGEGFIFPFAPEYRKTGPIEVGECSQCKTFFLIIEGEDITLCAVTHCLDDLAIITKLKGNGYGPMKGG